MENNNEKWKPVIGFEGLYEVSNLGHVKTLDRIRLDPIRGAKKYKEKILKARLDAAGYLFVALSQPNCRAKQNTIHRLVASAFIPNPENKPQVNHINGIKSDSRLENLEWVTASENAKHSFLKLGRIAPPAKRIYGAQNKLSKKIGCFIGDKLINVAYGQREASIKTGIKKCSINTSIQRGREIKGILFKYI